MADRGRKRARGDEGEEEKPRVRRPPAFEEPCFVPCTPCSLHASSSARDFSVLKALDRRAVGNLLCQRGLYARDDKLVRHLYHDEQPRLIREHELGQSLHKYDKVFALSWLDSDTLVMGTKCNKLLQVSLAPDVSRSKIVEIPIPDCSRRRTPAPEHLENCGIHAISLSPSRCRIVSGGRLPCDSVVLEATPSGSYDFLGTFTGHSDWVFGLAFVTESVFVSGSRDKSVAIWYVPPAGSRTTGSFTAATVRTEHNFKIRDIRFSTTTSRIGSVSSDGTYNLWDPNDLRLVRSYKLAPKPCFQKQETNVVCLGMEGNVAAVGSNTHLSVLDTRDRVRAFEQEVEEKMNRAWGIRSLSFRDHLLTVGCGSGRIYFVDLRSNRFLPLDSERGRLLDAKEAKQRELQHQHNHHQGGGDDDEEDPYLSEDDGGYAEYMDGQYLPGGQGSAPPPLPETRGKVNLCTGSGYIKTDDDTYQDYYSDLPLSSLHHACYAHEWDKDGTRLAAAGGPLPSGLVGTYAAVWQC